MIPWALKAGLAVLGGLAGITLVRKVSVYRDFKPLPGVDPYAPQDPTRAGQCDPVSKPGVKAFRAWAIANWGERPGSPQNILRDCRLGSPSEHWEGRAWDWMIPDESNAAKLIERLTADNNEYARRAGIMYIIYRRQMWRSYPYAGQPAGTWSPYTGPNPHTDHVHISFGWDGAMGRTSFYGPGGIAPLEGNA